MLLAGAFLALGWGCLFSRLPPEMPDDLVIEWREGGGENPASSVAIIAPPEGEWKFVFSGQEEQVYFTVTEEEMTEIYSLIRQNRLDTVRQENKQLYDSGNAGLTLRWEDEQVHISDILVQEKDRMRYQRVYGALNAFLETKVPQRPFEE